MLMRSAGFGIRRETFLRVATGADTAPHKPEEFDGNGDVLVDKVLSELLELGDGEEVVARYYVSIGHEQHNCKRAALPATFTEPLPSPPATAFRPHPHTVTLSPNRIGECPSELHNSVDEVYEESA
jgi:hypothetical protein